jgi:hypothetical protein
VNVTLSIDGETLTRARDLAARRGTSLNKMIRDYLEEVASDLSSDEIVLELNALWEGGSGDSRGAQWTREELHERTGVR